ncbi:hypothetical protein Trydic_g5318 [Trypoxylus dichotomus]
MITLGQKIIFFLCSSFAFAVRQCSVSDVRQSECFINETCMANSNSSNENIGRCKCKRGFERINESVCVQILVNKNGQKPTTSSLVDDSNSNHLALTVLIPLFIICVVIIGVYALVFKQAVKINNSPQNQEEEGLEEQKYHQDEMLSTHQKMYLLMITQTIYAFHGV